MGEESNPDLEQLTERVAEQIMFIVGSAPGDPKPAVVQLLRVYLEQVREQEVRDALHEQQLEEHDQQN